MIEPASPFSFGLWRVSIGVLAALSISSFALSAWLLSDLPREQEILERIAKHLPAEDLPQVRELTSEMQLQSRLLLLLVVNLSGSAIALTLLARGYVRSERHLRQVHVQAEDILASLNQGVITTDLDGRILNINPKAQELIDEPEIGTAFALSNLQSAHRPLDEMRVALLQGQAVEEQQYCAEQKHHLRYLRAGCSVLRDHNRQPAGVVIHLRDVTDKTLLQQRILRMERYMGLDSLAAGLQHEIKNPLSALALHVQLLKESLSQNSGDKEAISESMEVLGTEVHRITRVLESFRDFASVRDLNLVLTDVRLVIERILKLTNVEADSLGIQVKFNFDRETDFSVRIDTTRLEQVLLNLIVNAFAAMPDGGELTVELSKDDEWLTISVGDTGCGIPKEFQDKVFDPYFTTKATGTGMGLALCHKVVRQHSGTIDFVTSPQGTVFTIQLPSNG